MRFAIVMLCFIIPAYAQTNNSEVEAVRRLESEIAKAQRILIDVRIAKAKEAKVTCTKTSQSSFYECKTNLDASRDNYWDLRISEAEESIRSAQEAKDLLVDDQDRNHKDISPELSAK